MSVCFKTSLDDSFHPCNFQSTFGFHTSQTYPARIREKYVFVDVESTDKILFAKKKFLDDLASNVHWVLMNLLNIIGYIPILGLIPCCLRLYPLLDKDAEMRLNPSAVKTGYLVRAIFEGLGLGILLLIPDLIVTVKRFCIDKISEQERLIDAVTI